MQQQPPIDRVQEFRNFMGVVMFIARSLAVSVEVFLHRGSSFGERYLGPQGVVAGVIMFFFPIFWPQSDPRPLMWFLASFLALWMMAKLGIAVRRLRGRGAGHSYYTGRPRLMLLTRGRAEIQVKSSFEPALVIIAGMAVMGLNEPLGAYLMLAGVGLGVAVNASLQQDRTRALDMQDALMDQRRITDEWHGRR